MRAAASPPRDRRRARPRGDGRGAARALRAAEAQPRRAYADAALPIGAGQTISQPWIVAAICQALGARGPTRPVLEIGGGSGYSRGGPRAARPARSISIERIPELAASAGALDLRPGSAIDAGRGDRRRRLVGLPERAPFEAIAVHAAAPASRSDAARAARARAAGSSAPVARAGEAEALTARSSARRRDEAGAASRRRRSPPAASCRCSAPRDTREPVRTAESAAAPIRLRSAFPMGRRSTSSTSTRRSSSTSSSAAARRRRSGSATSRRKYERAQVVWITVGYRHGPREKIFAAVIDDVEVKRIRDLSPRDIEHDNPEFRRVEESIHFLEQIYEPRDRRRRPRHGDPLLADRRAPGRLVRQRRAPVGQLSGRPLPLPDHLAPRRRRASRLGRALGLGALARVVARRGRGRGDRSRARPARRVGRRGRYEWRSRIPYPVRFEVVADAVERPALLAGDASGELDGHRHLAPVRGRRGHGRPLRVERGTTKRWMNVVGAGRGARLPLEPRLRDARRRRGARPASRRPPAGEQLSAPAGARICAVHTEIT